MADEVYVRELPDCDIHQHTLQQKVTASYDGRTRSGPWANMCQDCFRSHGVGLGTGKGQRLIAGEKPTPDAERMRSQMRAALAAGDFAMAESLAIELTGEANLDEYL